MLRLLFSGEKGFRSVRKMEGSTYKLKNTKKLDNARRLLVSEHSQVVLLASCQTITTAGIPAERIEHAYFEKKWTH